jgi:hypothetical protein
MSNFPSGNPHMNSYCFLRPLLASIAMALFIASGVNAALISGDPATDAGWTLAGHSLQTGTHVKGSANYGFDAYSAGFTVQPGSNVEISDGSLSWLAGDSIVGVGGHFRSISAAEAGWSITGNAINSLLPTTSPYVGPKLQAKFGTSAATWVASTTAPDGGNGNSSSSNGGGRVQVRTSGYFQTGTPNPGQTEPWTWDGNSGQLLVLDKDSHIDWDGGDPSVDKRVARMIWNWDDTNKQVTSWELLLNVSLLDRVKPVAFSGLLPAIGDKAILTVQDGDNAYTDALVTVTQSIPEPTSFMLFVLASASLFVVRRRRRS